MSSLSTTPNTGQESIHGNNNTLSLVGIFYIAFGALVLSGAVFPFLKLDPAYAFLRPGLLYQGSVGLIAVIGIYLLMPLWRQVMARFVRAPFLLVLMAWMLASLIWTVAPQSRMAVAAALVTSTVYASYLAVVKPHRAVLRILAFTALAVMATSLIYTYAMTTRSFSFPGFDMMAGFYSNKNILVRVASMASVLAAFLLIWPGENQKHRDSIVLKAVWILILTIGIWMIAEYYTFTAKIAVLAAAAAVLLALAGSVSRRWFVALLVALMVAGLTFGIFLDEILAFARETSGLKNRLYHWGLMINQDLVSPWIGAGLGGFWDRSTGPWKELALLAPLRHGHNGFIDTWLDMGFIGLALVFANIATLAFRALRVPFARWHPLAYFNLGLFVVFLVYNLSESSILPTNSANTFLWAIFVALLLSPFAQRSVPKNKMTKDNS